MDKKPQPNTSTRSDWTIGIAEWILMDGSYNGFRVGETYQFAVEFYCKDFDVVSADLAALPHVTKSDEAPNLYSVIAPVTYKDDEFYVLDLGIGVYDECPSRDAQLSPDYAARAKKVWQLNVGDVVKADMYLNIDHYLYFEFLCFREGVPPIIYTWHVDSIDRMTANVMRDPDSPYSNVYCTDPETIKWERVDHTGGSLQNVKQFMLNCTLQPLPPVGPEHTIPLE
jgi:hypothetical protein